MAKIKQNITLNPELHARLTERAAKQGVSLSYIIECCASVGLNVLEGKDTKESVEQAVAEQLGPMLRMLQDVTADLNLPTVEQQQQRYNDTHKQTK